jgi:DNA-binding transcriptional ArsR family regulator
MRRVKVEGNILIGPTFSRAEFVLIERNLAEQQALQPLAELFRLAGNIHRLKILYLLYTHREMCVCDLAEVLAISDSAISQHLRKLRGRKLVKTRRERQTIYYSLVASEFNIRLRKLLEMDEAVDKQELLQ